MIYIKYIHPDLAMNTSYQAWLTSVSDYQTSAGSRPNWRHLYNWLSDHTRTHYAGEWRPKCWYSEVYLAGRHSKDCEHFRPKSSAKGLTANQVNKLKSEYGIHPVPEASANSASHYSWLEFNAEENYTLSSPHVNRTGNKGNVFPILAGTNRLNVDSLPSISEEYPLLLNPIIKHDTALFTVSATGKILPSFPFDFSVDKPVDFDSSPITYWNSAWVKGIRVYTSVVVYGLDHSDLETGRRSAFTKTRESIKVLEDAIKAGANNFITFLVKNLLDYLCLSAEFALASRSACQEYIKSGTAHNKTIIVLNKILTKINAVEDSIH